MEHLGSLPIAAIDLEHLGGILIAIIANLIPFGVFAIPVVIVALVFRYKNRQEKMWHETARLALEKGLPIPQSLSSMAEKRDGGFNLAAALRSDFRWGFVLAGIGIGLLYMGEPAGAIVGLIGLGLLLNGYINYRLGAKAAAKNPTANPAPPPQ